ncbi:uncharacterized protein LOC132707860 [Cylas formicarius]|uniref:uncharacterized protein LOC132707860 n=1 Tax=Cylas formicarius TaxID=197179 RepID=UPI0029587943|nr:uncharacterized protein LOC132707860 [Cylas formicarius]
MPGPTLMQKISLAEEAVKNMSKRIKALETRLCTEQLNEAKVKAITAELLETKKVVAVYRQQVSHLLHTHNRRSFLFVGGLVFVIFTTYMLYILINGVEI